MIGWPQGATHCAVYLDPITEQTSVLFFPMKDDLMFWLLRAQAANEQLLCHAYEMTEDAGLCPIPDFRLRGENLAIPLDRCFSLNLIH